MTIPHINGDSSKFLRINLGHVIVICVIAGSVWFDPRITYMQREIQLNREAIQSVDRDGTRKSQSDLQPIRDLATFDDKRIDVLETKQDNMINSLNQILARIPEKR